MHLTPADYEILLPDEVAPWRRAAAAGARRLVEQDLHLQPLTVLWVKFYRHRCWGFILPDGRRDTLYLWYMLPTAEAIMATVCHEGFHLHQALHSGEFDERDASLYEEIFLLKLVLAGEGR